ncbi:hypothetical protein B0O99DRAFT_689874 [Bisporella sp. PMI_857]|nr:hypothetical protein B0O99DRAFT_689874 [Bisporella sp. PMI_857]
MEKQSLDDMWSDAMERFRDLTTKNLKLSPPRTLDDIRKQIESEQADSLNSKAKDSKKRAKEIGMNALTCIKLLGGIAAQGASMVFGPAELCFNAVSLLLDIPSKIHDFHEAVDGLLDEVSVMLSQFKIYQRIEQFSNIDPELYDTIQKLMVSFVNICALSINLRDNASRWKRFKGSMKKVLLDDDSGVKGELDAFRSLIQKQSTIRETVTLENVLRNRKDLTQLLSMASETGQRLGDIATGVDMLTAAESNRKLEHVHKQQLENIRKKLLITNDTSKTLYSNIWADTVQRTGSWLRDIPEYNKWIDPTTDADPLLLITGDINSGKSYLMTAIVHELESIFSREVKTINAARKPVLAYHFLPKHSEKSGHAQKLAETGLKCLAFQIAERDASYAKNTIAMCDEIDDAHFKEATFLDLWRDLRMVAPKRNQTYFILLDGVDQLSDDDQAKQDLLDITSKLKSSLSDSDRSQIRVLLSGKTGTFKQDMFRDVPTIDIEQHNGAEIGFYIDQELAKRDLLLGRDSETVKMRDLIKIKLPKIAQGNFFKVQTAIEKIGEVVASDGSSAELEKILDQAGQDQVSIAHDVLGALGESLSIKEIAELNHLLIWAVFAINYFKVFDLKAALHLHFKKASLQPLEKKIKGKYAKIFEINNDGYVIVNEAIEEAIKTSERTRPLGEEEPQISATITITKANIKTVQNFLWTLTERAMINKFEFDESAALINAKGNIRVNELDSHLIITKQCLALLLADPDEKTDALSSYAMTALPTHLNFLRNDAEFYTIDIGTKREIGQGVFALLVDGDIIEKHWTSEDNGWYRDNYDGKYSWFYNEGEPSVFWNWLNDPDAIQYLGKKDKEWLKQLKSQPDPNRSLLEPITLMMARRWLRDREWDAKNTFLWISEYLQMAKSASDDNAEVAESVVADGSESEGDDSVDEDEDEDEDQDEVVEDEPDEEESVEDEEDDKSDAGSSSSSETDAPAVPALIVSAARWVQEALKIQELDSLWHERLGQTYSAAYNHENAIKEYEKATQDFDDPSWQSFQGLALAYGTHYLADLPKAVSTMERALDLLRKDDSPSEEIQSCVLRNLIQLADWRARLLQSDVAIKLYEEALTVDPNSSEARAKLLKITLTIGHDAQRQLLLDQMSRAKASNSDLSQLGALFQYILKDESTDLFFSMLFSAISKLPFFDILMKHLDEAIEFARLEHRIGDAALLLLYKGIALYHYDQRVGHSEESGLNAWEEVRTLTKDAQSYTIIDTSMRASRLISSYHFRRARTSPNPEHHISKMKEESIRRFGSGYLARDSRSYLGCYYAIREDYATAKQVFLEDMKSALALLSDDVEYNDHVGYRILAEVLMHSGDSLNALSAWSLLGPNPEHVEDQSNDNAKEESEQASEDEDAEDEDQEKSTQEAGQVEQVQGDGTEQTSILKGPKTLRHTRGGDLDNHCDGLCGRNWSYADDFYCCTICPDIQFCSDCLAKLPSGELRVYICDTTHNWLHIPKWDDLEFAETREGKVKFGGEFVDGKRVGGRIETVAEWLNLVRDDWGLPRVEKVPAGSR